MGAEDTARKVLAEVGVWWPAADEAALRRAADDWDALAHAVDDAAATTRGATSRALSQWQGDAAARFAGSAAGLGTALGTDAEAARALARALRQYADAVAAAVRDLEEQAALLGASIVAGTVLAIFTFGVSEVAAAGVTAALISAAEAIGVMLTDTVAAIAGGTIAGIGVGAVEGVAVDAAVAQPMRVELFHDGRYSASELGESGLLGAGLGGLGGGAAKGLAARRLSRTALGDLEDSEPNGSMARRPIDPGRIRATLDPPDPAAAHPPDPVAPEPTTPGALDPTTRGALADRFRPGVHEGNATPGPAVKPGTDTFKPHERTIADLVAEDDKSVHARPESAEEGVTSPDAIVRSGPDDPGTLTEFKSLTSPRSVTVSRRLRDAADQLEPHGGGDTIIDGRAAGLSHAEARAGLDRYLGSVRSTGRGQLPGQIRIVLGDGSSIRYP